MSEYTSTPWKLAGIPDNMIICDAEGGSIADCAPPGPWMRDKEALANAAFIVKACNAHDDLVKALEQCRTSYCGYAITKSEQYPDILANFWKEIKRIDGIARAALETIKVPS